MLLISNHLICYLSMRFLSNRNCVVGPRGAKLSKTMTEVSNGSSARTPLILFWFGFWSKVFPDGLGARSSKPDNEHSVNSQHGADGEERSSQPGEGWKLFSFCISVLFCISLSISVFLSVFPSLFSFYFWFSPLLLLYFYLISFFSLSLFLPVFLS